MELSREDQRILTQLSDMFADVPQTLVRQVCEENKFDIELCIDQLISNPEKSTGETSNYANATEQNEQSLYDFSWSSICRSKSCEKESLQQGAIPKNSLNPADESGEVSQKSIKHSRQSTTAFTSKEQHILDQILMGYRVMIIMRGAPGSGKSYLANELLQKSIDKNVHHQSKDFIYSADDYFFNNRGQYRYNIEKLEDAHAFNQRRVFEKAANGWSPIVVDNTNMKLWEMLPYAKAAVQYGYILEILEPTTPWRFSAGKLAMKNHHKVPKEKIQKMLDKYEKGNVSDLFKILKDTKYCLPLPQMRNFPPIVFQSDEMDTNENFQEFDSKQITDPMSYNYPTLNESTLLTSNNTITSNNPKPQRKPMKSKSSSKIALNLPQSDTEMLEENNNKLLPNATPLVWKPYEVESNQFWGVTHEAEGKPSVDSNSSFQTEKSEKTLLDLLKEDVNELAQNKCDMEKELDEQIHFQRHKLNCPNENKAFASLRQIYPNKQLSGLWDLFVKCSGDIDWAVDILLKEDELSTAESHYDIANNDDDECMLMCSCSNFGDSQPSIEVINLLKSTTQNTSGNIKPQRPQRPRTQRFSQNPTSAQREVKEAIENNFVLGEEFYSEHVRKIKNLRSGTLESAQSSISPRSLTDTEVQTDAVTMMDAEDDMENGDSKDLLEINLGQDFVKQLSVIFSTETLDCKLPENLKTNVFMPKTLAKELFMLWMESAYNQIEEKRQSTCREDEEFAHLLKNPKYEHFKETPKNIKEILDMELAWMIYKNEHDEQKRFETRHYPRDIASHLTQMKLCELFPNIPRETLLDILAAHDNKFKETIDVLQGSISSEECTTTQEDLLQRAIQENELLNNQVEDQQKQQYKSQYPIHSSNDYQRPASSPLLPDESRRVALREFEETRNFAAHHCQLKAECYQKAKDAIQKGNSSVAVYYSQIANLHKKKVDMYNHRAANCIMEVHKYTQNNPDLLDLHYLYVLEAVGCLDLFLDRHITNLRSLSKSYKHVFIITGRGLHSAGGVSTIKNKVKSRLKERSLRWSEVNPGLLKVKIFSASRYSKNI